MNQTIFLQPVRLLVAAAVMALSGIGAAQAVTYNYDFGVLLTPPGDTGSPTFASLSVDTTDNKIFTFDLRVNDLDAVFAAGAYIGGMNVNTLSGDDATSNTTLSTGYSLPKGVTNVSLVLTGGTIGGVTWEFGDAFGGGSDQLVKFEQIRWTTTFATEQSAPFFGDPAFALKVNYGGFNDNYTSTLAPIPEPEIYAMLGVGLGLMGWAARRRKQQSA